VNYQQNSKIIKIAGGGIAGLSAAINLKKSGFNPIVFEKNHEVGGNRHGDYEGLENWIFSNPMNIIFNQIGFNFKKITSFPISEFKVHSNFFSPLSIYSKNPFFYMVKRGKNSQDFDSELFKQCKDIGVQFKLGTKAPDDCSIIATGTKKASAYIRGINFKTNLSNQVHLLLGNQFAPKGYAYLIIIDGKGTLASAFKKQKSKDIDIIKTCRTYFKSIGIEIPEGEEFGSRGSFSLPFRNFKLPYLIGEAGGYQDYLFGFGMRMSMLSGLSAALLLVGKEGQALPIIKDINKKRKLSFVNRLLYERLNDRQIASLAKKLAKVEDPLSILSEAYKWNIKNFMRWKNIGKSYEIHIT
jgi:flavin-dependent dehydrogenase